MRKWTWGYVAAGVAVALVWVEFMRSVRRPPPPPEATRAAASEPAPATGQPTPSQIARAQRDAARAAERAALQAMERMLTDPPPISLSLRNSTLGEMVDALNKALGPDSCLALHSPPGPDRRVYTLEVTGQSFWDVFTALQTQRPFQIATNVPGIRIAEGGMAIRHFARSGPVIAYATGITYSRSGSGQARGGTSTPSYSLSLAAIIDPRLYVVRQGGISILRATDETGAALPVAPIRGARSTGASNGWRVTMGFPLPERAVRRLNLECSVAFEIPMGQITMSLEDAGAKVGSILALGVNRLKLAQFSMSGERLTLRIVPEENISPVPPLSVTVTDSKGRRFVVESVSAAANSYAANYLLAGATGPFKMELWTPQDIREVTVPLELRDLPMP